MWTETSVRLNSLYFTDPLLLWSCLALIMLEILSTLPPRFPTVAEGITLFRLYLWASSERAEIWTKWAQSSDNRLHPCPNAYLMLNITESLIVLQLYHTYTVFALADLHILEEWTVNVALFSLNALRVPYFWCCQF